ncbi:putative baseplate assembly protein [Lunatibacter salilacus]|uniref:putative baseplate assembly protein n=1 Tax=Lunatibacter salilacus TaxID=2483804 RepID=UPI00131BC4FB|nr:putative baseplate assembly protein [Lunatibacter salilacus]
MNSIEKTLDNCGCCRGVEFLTPQIIHNDTGLSALMFRIGTHGTFKESMLRGLSESEILRQLTTRENNDHTIALIDAWATVLDVLTFYNERFLNEGYLRTAVERLSLVELARHISYRPNPGVAASTWLAFSMEEAPGAPLEAIAPIGMKVQSIPGQDEKPQIFETIEEIRARTQWNAIKPKLSETQLLIKGSTQLYLQGTSTQLQIGDLILVVGDERIANPGSERWDINTVESVTVDVKKKHTLITWREGLGHEIPLVNLSSNMVKVYVFRQRAALFGYNAPDVRLLTSVIDTSMVNESTSPIEWANFEITNPSSKTIFLDAIYPKILTDSWLALIEPDYAELYRVKEATDGAQTNFSLASKSSKLLLDTDENLKDFPLRDTVVLAQSELLELAKAPILSPVFGNIIELDKEQPELREGQFLILRGQLLKQVQVTPREQYVRTGSTINVVTKNLTFYPTGSSSIHLKTGVILDVLQTPIQLDNGKIKWIVRYNNSEGYLEALHKDLIPYELPRTTNAPEPATSLNKPKIVSELCEIEKIEGPDKIKLKVSLSNVYLRHTVEINANIALATHGETKSEILGSGYGSLFFQKFKLKQKPLTYIPSSDTTTGHATTLEIRVNNIKWKEFPTLYGKSTNDRGFVTRAEDDGTTSIQFGDGITGARLPSGSGNIRAKYRVGIGMEGEVKAGELSLLMTPQLGIKSVINPLPATGADEPEAIENIRSNSPLTVLTLDRIVSVLDYENFANAYAGIGKARADLMWKGEVRIVHLTVASASEGAIDDSLKTRLLKAIDDARHENFPVVINSFEKLLFNVIAKVKIHQDYLEDKVKTKIREMLVSSFNFRSRNFGQSVTPSEVIAAIQTVEGVIAVDLDQIGGQNPFSSPHFLLMSRKSRWAGGAILPAQLLQIDPESIEINQMA